MAVTFSACASALVGVVLVSFAGLVAVGSGGIQMEYLTNQDWSKVPSAVPVMYIAMVFHNVIPVVTTQLEGKTYVFCLVRWLPGASR